MRMQDVHNKYGPIVRIAPGKYSFDDPEANKTIYAAGSKFIKVGQHFSFSLSASTTAGMLNLRPTLVRLVQSLQSPQI